MQTISRLTSLTAWPALRFRAAVRFGLGGTAAVLAALATVAPAAATAAPFEYVGNLGDGSVSQYDAAGGALVPLSPASTISGGEPFGVAVTPDGTSVYVAKADDIAQYDVNADGTLTPKTQPTVASGGGASGVAVTPDGKGVYVSNGATDTLWEYDVGPGGALTPTIPASVPTSFAPGAVAVSPDGKSVYVADASGDVISQYSVGAGEALTPKVPPTVPTGVGPIGLAVSPDGKRVYVTNSQDNTVSQYDVRAGGALRPRKPAAVAAGSQPVGIAVSPDSRNIYTTNSSDDLVGQYVFSGGLSLRTPATAATGASPRGIVVAPDGKSVYVSDVGGTTAHPGGAVSQYNGGSGTATLTAKFPPNVAAGQAPGPIAIGPAHVAFRCSSIIFACIVHILPVSTNTVVIIATQFRAAPIGILVQRIAGRRLADVGRVPFGPQEARRMRLRWNLRVGGHRLAGGRYLVTLRMFDHHQHLIALARPVEITVR